MPETKSQAVDVRRAHSADAADIERLALAFHEEDGHPLSREGVAAVLAMLEPGFSEGLILVATVDAKICGYGALSFGYGVEHGGRETFIEDIYVIPAMRGKGCGARLFQALEVEARGAGCRAVHLEVMPGNRAERWYRRMGYADRGSILLTKPL